MYVLWKTAHIVSAAILFGGGLAIAFFCWLGYRSAMRGGGIAALRATLRLTVVADACLTAHAVVFQAASGLILVNVLGWPYLSPWSMATWALFLFVGACWIPVLAIQWRLSREARAAPSLAALSREFHCWFRVWFALGRPAFRAVLAILYLMVGKPLPGF